MPLRGVYGQSRVTEWDEALERPGAKVAQLCAPFARAPALLDQVPGTNERIAQVIVAEAGPGMRHFRGAGPLAAWAGACPGNCETAGERRSGQARPAGR